MKRFFSGIFLLFLLFCTSCKRTKKPVHEPPLETLVEVPVPVQKDQVIMKVDGVECPLCAQLVVDQLAAIPDISDIQYVVKDDQYEIGYIQFNWNKRTSVPVKQIVTAIETQGFSVTQLTGSFFGKFLFNYNKQQVFTFEDVDLSYPVSLSEEKEILIDQKNWNMLLDKGTVDMVATLKLTEDGQSFIFVPKRLYEII